MIWKNPFSSKHSDHQEFYLNDFLRRFDCSALQIINKENLSMVTYISSTPGAGKTSLFYAFTPEVLSSVARNEDQNREFYKKANELGVLEKDRVCLASTIISCARGNYSIIDEMFQNGRRKQITFALLNYRIAIGLLRSIGRILNITSQDYHRITFYNIPDEMVSDEQFFQRGDKLYLWACEGEKKLCRYLDSSMDEMLNISFIHTTLLLIKLFEPENVLFDGKRFLNDTLVIFDDFHKLSENQKEYIPESIYTLKSSAGVWFGQRLEGLKKQQIISMDGSLNRDYNTHIVIDNYWVSKSAAYYKMLDSIADRRVMDAEISNCTSLKDCFESELTTHLSKKRLEQFVHEIVKAFRVDTTLSMVYDTILKKLENTNSTLTLKEKATIAECMVIRRNRSQTGQMTLFSDEPVLSEEFDDFVLKNKLGAWFYVTKNTGLPFYCGIETLHYLSSYNVEQFLDFSGTLFEWYRTKTLGAKPGKRIRLTMEEQEKALVTMAKKRWDDIDLRYSDAKDIKLFLDQIGTFCQISRDQERNSYEGGSYTGFAIERYKLDRAINDAKYARTIDILAKCVESGYLEKHESETGDNLMFYLGRWLCVHYQLPLAYGGWKRYSIDDMNTVFEQSGGYYDRLE